MATRSGPLLKGLTAPLTSPSGTTVLTSGGYRTLCWRLHGMLLSPSLFITTPMRSSEGSPNRRLLSPVGARAGCCSSPPRFNPFQGKGQQVAVRAGLFCGRRACWEAGRLSALPSTATARSQWLFSAVGIMCLRNSLWELRITGPGVFDQVQHWFSSCWCLCLLLSQVLSSGLS